MKIGIRQCLAFLGLVSIASCVSYSPLETSGQGTRSGNRIYGSQIPPRYIGRSLVDAKSSVDRELASLLTEDAAIKMLSRNTVRGVRGSNFPRCSFDQQGANAHRYGYGKGDFPYSRSAATYGIATQTSRYGQRRYWFLWISRAPNSIAQSDICSQINPDLMRHQGCFAYIIRITNNYSVEPQQNESDMIAALSSLGTQVCKMNGTMEIVPYATTH